MKHKNLQEFRRLGGLKWVAKQLHTNLDTGLDVRDFPSNNPENGETWHDVSPLHMERIKVYGTNEPPKQKCASFWSGFLDSLLDKAQCCLMGALVLQIGLFVLGQALGASSPSLGELGQSLTLFFNIILVAAIGAGIEYRKQTQFIRLAEHVSALLLRGIASPAYTFSGKPSDGSHHPQQSVRCYIRSRYPRGRYCAIGGWRHRPS